MTASWPPGFPATYCTIDGTWKIDGQWCDQGEPIEDASLQCGGQDCGIRRRPGPVGVGVPPGRVEAWVLFWVIQKQCFGVGGPVTQWLSICSCVAVSPVGMLAVPLRRWRVLGPVEVLTQSLLMVEA